MSPRPSEIYWYWLSSDAMTVTVGCRAERQSMVLVDLPPIVRRFYGQDLRTLSHWMAKQGNFRIEESHGSADRP